MTAQTLPEGQTCHLCGTPIGDSRIGFDSDCMQLVVEAIELAKAPEFPFTDLQRSKAVDLVRTGGLARRVISGLSHDEFDTYVIDPRTASCSANRRNPQQYVTSGTYCNCPASRICYHRLAVLAVIAVRKLLAKKEKAE